SSLSDNWDKIFFVSMVVSNADIRPFIYYPSLLIAVCFFKLTVFFKVFVIQYGVILGIFLSSCVIYLLHIFYFTFTYNRLNKLLISFIYQFSKILFLVV